MASSEVTSSELLGRVLTGRRVESVESAATVRHVDQLETETFQEFYELAEDGNAVPASETDLEEGEVIIFTEYVRIESL